MTAVQQYWHTRTPDLTTVLLLHGDNQPSTTVIDSSPFGRVPSIGGSGLQVVESAGAFGASALYTVAGSQNFVQFDGEFAAEGEDCTVEYFMQWVSTVGAGDGYSEHRGEFLRIESEGTFLHTANGSIGTPTNLIFAVPLGTGADWAVCGLAAKTDRVHVAWTRHGDTGNTQLFFNGRYVADGTSANGAIDRVYVGNRYINFRSTTAYVDELRIRRGIREYVRVAEAVNSVVFTPPTGPF